MDERAWVYPEDGQLEGEQTPRIDGVNWGDAQRYGLDTDMVGLAIGTDHVDAKIALSRQLIDLHDQHAELRKNRTPSNNQSLLPEKILDRLVYGMITECAGNATIPNILLRLLSLRMKVSPHPQKGIQDLVAYRNLLHVAAENPGIGRKKAAEAVGISGSVARKWMASPEFEESVAVIRDRGIKGGT